MGRLGPLALSLLAGCIHASSLETNAPDTPADVGPGGRTWWGCSAGPAVASLRGEGLEGTDLRMTVGRTGIGKRRADATGLHLDLGGFFGGGTGWSAYSTVLGLGIDRSAGPFVYGGGFDVGYSRLAHSDLVRAVSGLVIGPRAFAGVNLVRMNFAQAGSIVNVYVGLDGAVATPRFYRGSFLLGVRFASAEEQTRR